MIELWHLLGRPARGRLILALALSAAAGASGVILLGLSGWFLTAAALAGMSGGGYIFNHLYPSAGVRAAAFARVLTRYGEQLLGHDATLGISAALRPKVFVAAAQNRRGFMPLPAADLAAIIDDVDAAEAGFLKVISPLFAMAASLFVALGFAFAADFWSGCVAVLTASLAAIVLPFHLVRSTGNSTETLASLTEETRQRTARLVENATELETMNALGLASGDVRRRLETLSDKERSLDGAFRGISTITGALGALTAIFIVGRGTVGDADLALCVAAALAVIAAFDAAAAMVSVLNAANRSRQAARRLVKRVATPDPDWNPPETYAHRLEGLFPIVASGLVFSPSDTAPRLGPVDFEIGEGEIVQLVAPSGTGKSTLAETLMRLHPILAGKLTYGGVAASDLRMASVLERIAYAPQLPAFLPGLLIEQLKIAHPLAVDDDVARALSIACAQEFLAQSVGGLSSEFSEGVYPFSGGELRRLGIARALLADPQLLILDEPLAGLDDTLAQCLADNLRAWVMQKPRALLVIGHQSADVFGGKVVTPFHSGAQSS